MTARGTKLPSDFRIGVSSKKDKAANQRALGCSAGGAGSAQFSFQLNHQKENRMALTPDEIKEWRKPLSDTWLNPAPTLHRRLQKALDALEEAQRKGNER